MLKKILFVFLSLFISFTSFAITNKQKSDLLFIYEEKKMMKDFYSYLDKKYNSKVFNVLVKSETTEMTQIKILLKTYKIEIPLFIDGKFTNKSLNNLYKKLIKESNGSLENALKKSIELEEKSIESLKEKIIEVPNDVKLTYQNLLLGSEKHKKDLSKDK